MKLSRREKVLISILLIAVVVYFGYQYIPFDKMFKLSVLEEEYSQKKSTYDTMSQNIILKTNYEKKVEELSAEINSINMLSSLDQEKIIVFLNKYLANNNIDANNITFSDITAVPVSTALNKSEPKVKSTFENMIDDINNSSETASNRNETTQETSAGTSEAQTNPEQLQSNGDTTVKSVSVSISFESGYSDMLKFIDAIQTNPVNIAITNINTLSQEGDILQGTITLNFYSVPKLEGYVEENKDWIWEDLMQSGKSNPFLLEGGTAFVNSTSNSYDFYMSLKPESSDLPTVILGRADDKTRATYVYADSNVMENVELQFKKEDSKYYYKYSTKNSKFPADGTWLEFTPVGSSISFKVYSSSRNSKVDSSGANISITNTSGLKVRFTIEDDDKTNPRVYFKDPKSVIVTRK